MDIQIAAWAMVLWTCERIVTFTVYSDVFCILYMLAVAALFISWSISDDDFSHAPSAPEFALLRPVTVFYPSIVSDADLPSDDDLPSVVLDDDFPSVDYEIVFFELATVLDGIVDT